jgi:hypothetical protein
MGLFDSRAARLVGALALSLAVALPVVGAETTSWRTFSDGVAFGRERGDPSVSLRSTTRSDPAAIRFIVRGTKLDTSVRWGIYCWSAGTFVTSSAVGDIDAILPIRKRITEVDVSKWDSCEVNVKAGHLEPGRISVKIQARYER